MLCMAANAGPQASRLSAQPTASLRPSAGASAAMAAVALASSSAPNTGEAISPAENTSPRLVSERPIVSTIATWSSWRLSEKVP